MAQTQLRGTQVGDGTIQRQDLDVSTPGSAVVRKLIAGTNVTFTSTGADAGTGDVTINATGSGAAPGGSNTQLQYNNNGVLAGLPLTYDSTNGGLTYSRTAATPGTVNLLGVTGTAGNGGAVYVNGGESTTANGGQLNLTGGPGSSGAGVGGQVFLQGGQGNGTGNGGATFVQGGLASSSGVGGQAQLAGGTSSAGAGGDVIISGGIGATQGGAVSFRTGLANSLTTRFTLSRSGEWLMGGSVPGNAGQVLTSNGAGAAPTWQGVVAAVPDWTQLLDANISTTPINDYTPAGFTANHAVLRLNPAVNTTLTGLTGGSNGRVLCILNRSGFTLTLESASASSAAANQFQLPVAAITLKLRESVFLRYNSSIPGWEILAYKQLALDDANLFGVLPASKGGTGQTSLYAAIKATLGTPANAFLKGTGAELQMSSINLGSADVTGTLPVANGGTGQTTIQAALNALAGGVTANRVLRANGTNVVLAQVALATDVTGTLPVANGGTGLSALPGTTKEIFYNNAGVLAAATNVEIDSGDITLIANATPVTPPAGMTKLFCRTLGNRQLPAFIGPSGLDTALQPAFFRNRIGLWIPIAGSATGPTPFGLSAVTTVGTATARAIAATSMATRTRRLGYVSAATAGALCGHFGAAAQYSLGGVAGTVALGGFFLTYKFVVSDAAAVTGARMFIGLSSAVGTPTNVEPNTIINCVGVAKLSTSNNLFIVYGGSAAQTAIDLGANFPANTLSADVYQLVLFNPPGNNLNVYYRVERLNTGQFAEGTLTAATAGTQLPANTTLLAQRAWRCNNATALAVGLDVGDFYIETDD